MKNNLKEIILAGTLIVLAILFANPFHFWMPSMLVSSMILTMIIAFGGFASFVWKEKTCDEREQNNKVFAGRLAFLIGMALVVLGIVYQEYTHSLDKWLVVVLLGMITAKFIGHWYVRRKW